MINEKLIQARKGMTASPRCPSNGNKSVPLSEQQNSSQGPAPRSRFQLVRQFPCRTFPPGCRQGPGQDATFR